MGCLRGMLGTRYCRSGDAAVSRNPERPARSTIKLNPAQVVVLEWVQSGCPDGVYPAESYTHRVTARALASRGLVRIRGHGASWRADPTERGRVWPEPTGEDEAPASPAPAPQQPGAAVVEDENVGATVCAMRRVQRTGSGKSPKKPRTRQVQKQETYMRYKVVVTRVQVAERWVRATDEEDAAKKVQEEFSCPYGYFGSWKDVASEVEVVEAEQTAVIRPNLLSESGPMLLSFKDAG